jgi:ferritin-like metal-binding protein YciE
VWAAGANSHPADRVRIAAQPEKWARANKESQMKTMEDLFLHFLKDVYYAERQISKALPKMAKAAENPALKEAFTHHREETQHQIERLQKVFEAIGKRAQGVTCEAINGLIEECEELLEEAKEPSAVRDSGLIACAQAVEHYEMARYGSLVAWARAAGRHDAVALLQQTLDEEKKTDTLLNQLAERELTPKAKKAA